MERGKEFLVNLGTGLLTGENGGEWGSHGGDLDSGNQDF